MTTSSITSERAERGQIRNAMQVDAAHVNGNQERQVDGSGSRSDKGKGGKGKSKKGSKGKERREKAAKFDGECRYCLKTRRKKSDCTKMKSDIAAGKCDWSGKGVNALSAAGATQPSPQTELCTEHGKHHSIATGGASVLPVFRRLSDVTETRYISVLVLAPKALMVPSLDGAEYALLDSGSSLDVLPN